MTAFCFTMAMLMIGSTQPALVDGRGSEPVARAGNRTITRLEISCELTSDDLEAIAGKQNRDRDSVCLDREQLRLDYLLTQELHDAAVRKLAIEVSAEDLAADAAFHHYGEAEFVRLSEQYRRLAGAAVLVYDGEDAHAVYQRDVRGNGPSPGQSEERFRRFVALLRSSEGAKRFIERQTPGHFRDSITSDARQRVARDKLMQRLSDLAQSSNLSYAAYSVEFWGELCKELGVEILDSRYRLLSLRGLSWQPKQRPLP